MSRTADPDVLLSKLDGVRRRGKGWTARCPAHADTHPSLDIDLSDEGKLLLICRSNNCTAEEIVAAVGLPIDVLFPPRPDGNQQEFEATYQYRGEARELLFEVVRFPGKKFRQRRPDGGGWTWKLNGVRRVPYRFPELLAADKAALVFIPEGEKDCEALVRRGLQATTNPGGGENWKVLDQQAVRAALGSRRVVILPDNDEKGEAHAADVADRLKGVAAEVRILKLPGLPPKGDVSDWLAAGGTKDKLLELVESSAGSAGWERPVPLTEWPAEWWDDRPGIPLWFDQWPESGLVFRVVTVDPSKGEGGGDYQAIASVALHRDGSLWCDVDLRRENVKALVGRSLRVAREWRADRLGAEVNGTLGVLAMEYREQMAGGALIPFDAIDSKLPKDLRILTDIGPYLSRGRLRVRRTRGGQELASQGRQFPHGTFDDALDAVGMGIRLIAAWFKK